MNSARSSVAFSRSLICAVKLAWLSTAVLTFAACSHTASRYSDADLNVVKQAMAQAQQSDLAYELVASLTTEVGPRPAGSSGDAAAVSWAKAKLTALGFDRVWTVSRSHARSNRAPRDV